MALALATDAPPRSTRERAMTVAALLAVYVIWGSTYYAMHVAMGFLPPFLMAGPRFATAGVILLAVQRARGSRMPTAREWAGGSVIGVLLLVFGNGLVAMAQRSVDSGVAAIVVATMPLWVAVFASVWGERPTAREAVGLVIGFAGIVVLNQGGSLSFGDLHGALLMLAAVSWAFGSLLSKRIVTPPGLVGTAVQMIAGGTVMTVVALARGDRPTGPATPAAIGALLFLVLFGSLVAFSAYGYLLRTTRPAVATSYAYVNPMVALAIGAALGGEQLTPTKLLACLLTIGGVVVVTRGRRGPAPVQPRR